MTEPAEPSGREELLDLYKIAVEEYRFQVKLNADRSRDYFVVNSAIIAAAITLLGQAKLPLLAGTVFLIGFVVAVLSIFGTHTQHGYYRDTRKRTTELEQQLGNEALVRTKPTGSRYRRFGSVTNFNYIILGLLCLVDLMGASFSFATAIPPPKASTAIIRASSGQKPAAPQLLQPKGPPSTTPKGPIPSSAIPHKP